MADKLKWLNGTPVEMLGFNLQDSARLARRNFDRGLQAKGVELTQAQWRSLATVFKRPGISQSGLADILEMSPISIARLIDRMEAAGWMERRPDPGDRRAVCLYVTSKAEPVMKTLKANADELRARMTKGISKADLETTANVLAALRANLVEMGD